jgi:hypothetical protein
MKTKQLFKANNTLLEREILQSIKELPKLKVNQTTVHDFAFTQPIVELTTKQTTNFKNLINGHN